MDKKQVAKRMMELVDELSNAEAKVIGAGFALDVAKAALADIEAELLICEDSPINGKNAEIRAAQMRQETTAERQAIQAAEAALLKEKTSLNKLQNEFKALRAIVAILSNQIHEEVA
jgi:hypothetical protein